MKKLILLLSMAIVVTFAINQALAQDFKNAFKLIEDKNYTEAKNIFSEGLKINPNCPISNYGLAIISSHIGSLSGNLITYEYLRTAKEFNGNLEEYAKTFKVKKILTEENIIKMYKTTDSILYDIITASNNIDSLNKYIDVCKYSNYLSNVIKYRDSIAYEIAKNENSISSFEYFIKQYPKALQVPNAKKNIAELDYYSVLHKRDVKEYKRYINEYPQSEHCRQLNDSIALYEFYDMKSNCTIADLTDFIQNHPNFEMAKSLLYQKEFDIAKKVNSLELYKRFKEKYFDAPVFYTNYVDSMIVLKEILTKDFPNAEKFKIVYLKDGNLWIMDEDGTNQCKLTNSNQVFSFICPKNGGNKYSREYYPGEVVFDEIYYAELIDSTSILISVITLNRCTNNWNPLALPSIRKIIKISFDDYIPESLNGFYNFKNIRDEIIGLDTKDNVCRLFLGEHSLFFFYQVDVFPGQEYNFYEYGIVLYKKAYEIDLSAKEIKSFYNDPGKRFYRNYEELEQFPIPENSTSFDNSSDDDSHLFFQKNDKTIDLMFLSNKGIKKIKSYNNDEFRGINNYYQCKLSNGKTFFNYKTELGDLGDDPVPLLINKDGSNITSVDFTFWGLQAITTLNCNKELLVFQKDSVENSNTYSLVTYVGNNNTPCYLVKNISWAEKLNGLYPYYEVDRTIFTRKSKTTK